MLVNLKMLEINIFEIVGKGGDRTFPKIRLIFFENLEHGIKIVQKARNGHVVIWDQYLPITSNIFVNL